MCRERTKRGALLRGVPYGVPLEITYWPNKTLYQHGKPFRCTYLYLFWACQLCRFRVSAQDVTVLPEGVFNVEIPKTFRFNDLNNSRRACVVRFQQGSYTFEINSRCLLPLCLSTDRRCLLNRAHDLSVPDWHALRWSLCFFLKALVICVLIHPGLRQLLGRQLT